MNQGGQSCISFGGRRIDEAVAEHVIEAIQPVGVQAAIDAWTQMQQQEDQKVRAVQLALERARYESERARRQYDAIEPENRLVAAELERRWEQSLQQVSELEERLTEAGRQLEPLSDEQRQRLLALGQVLQRVWEHPHAAMPLKKRILRTVLEEIVADVSDDPPQVRLVLHWTGGVHSPLVVAKNRTGQHSRTTDRTVLDLVRDLAKVCNDGMSASILNRLGYRTGCGNTWTEARVRSLRATNKIPAFRPDAERTWVTLTQAALELDVSVTVVRRLLLDRTLPGHRTVSGAPWIIERKDLKLPAVQAAVKNVRGGHRRPRTVDCESQVPLFQDCSEV